MKIRSAWTALVLMALLWVATPTPASAQGSAGVLLGFNSANVDFDVSDVGTFAADRRKGFVGGIFIERTLQGIIGVEVDALFTQKGTTLDFAGDEPFRVKLNYLDIPVMARLNLGAADVARIHLYAGPSFNLKLSETFEPEGEDDPGAERLELGLVFGGGVSVSRFRVDVRYGLGLNSAFSEEALEVEGTGKNRVISILFGIALAN